MIGAIPLDDAALCGELLALNNAHAIELSLLDGARFAHLCRQAFAAWHVDGEALLIAFDENADYDSDNFIHLRKRFDRFVYIDRVVTAHAARGRGHARRLYDALEVAASRAGHSRLVCEVNIDPPNPASGRFHATRGFTSIGDGVLASGKHVGYLEKTLATQIANV